MKTHELLARLDRLQVQLWSENGKLRFRAPQGVMTDALKSELRAQKDELLAILNGASRAIPRLADQPSYALSHSQRRLWVLSQLEDGSAAYNIPLHQILIGPLNIDTLGSAISQVVKRHESLRTSIVMLDDEPRQVVHDEVDTILRVIDFRDRDDPLRAAKELARQDAREPFDLERGPLFRAAVAQLGGERYVLLFTIHHIVCDGSSIGVLAKEIANRYEAIQQGDPAPLPPLAIQYRDYADWEKTLLAGGALARHRDWWLEQLGGSLPVLDLPTDFPRPALQSFEGSELGGRIDADKLDAIHRLARQSNASLYMTLLSMLYALLYKYTGQKDIIVGSPVAGRNHPDLDQQIGLYLNTLALTAHINEDKPFAEFLTEVRQMTVQAFDHQSYPFDRLVDELLVQRDLSRNPLFDVTLILQNQDDSGLSFEQINVESLIEHPGTSKTDLTFCFKAVPSGLLFEIEYNTDLFKEDRIARMRDHFVQLVDSIIDSPAESISRLNILTRDESRQLLQGLNETSRSYPDKTVVDLFQEQVRASPDAVAVVCDDRQTTYRQLQARVDQVASHLRGLGIGRDALVAVCLDRGVDMVAAVLGVMKAGGAYVPLDPTFPRERLGVMLLDSQAAVLLTQQSFVGALPESEAHVVCIDAEPLAGRGEPPAADPVVDAVCEAAGDSLAYVIYTSGSTGRPKGVQIPHRALTNFLCAMAREPGLTKDDALLGVTTLSFDIAGLEIFLPLIQGAKLILASSETAADGLQLLELLDGCGASVMQATPATWQMLIEAGWRGTPGLKILCGGEALLGGLSAQLQTRGASVWNMYGPTETTIWSTCCKLDRASEGAADTIESIGRPIANTQIYIFDRNMLPVPYGVPGDLYIGGDGLARGYHQRPELTAERYVMHELPNGRTVRLYKTGDTACYRADGSIDFLGRTDHQVKLRGFRIELGEIEAALQAHPAIVQAVADVRDDPAGDRHLAAWFVATGDTAVEAGVLREHLRSRLPGYMIPTRYRQLAELPLTLNNKVDRKALAVAEAGEARPAYEPPATETQRQLVSIWREVFQADAIGIHDNFFDLGGHSLKAAAMLSKVQQAMSVRLSLVEVFQHPTIETLAEVVSQAGEKSMPEILPLGSVAAGTSNEIQPLTAEELEMLNE